MLESVFQSLGCRIRALEVDFLLVAVDGEVKRNAFSLAKQRLAECSQDDLIELLQRSRQFKTFLHSPEKVSTCIFSLLSSPQPQHVSALENMLAFSMHKIFVSFHVEEVHFAKRVLERLPRSKQLPACLELSSRLVHAKNQHTHQQVRALGLDIAGLCCCEIDLLPLVEVALKSARHVDRLHRGIEDAVFRLAVHSHRISVGSLLVQSLHQYRSLSQAYKCVRMLQLDEYFPDLILEGQREQIRTMIHLGPHKAFGYVTLKPNRRHLTMAMLIEHGFHLTAKRLAFHGIEDYRVVQDRFGQVLDERECARECDFRSETCVQLPSTVSVHWVDSVDKLVMLEPLLLGKGLLTLDVEWVPTLGSNNGGGGVELIQFARGKDHVFLLDPPALQRDHMRFHAFMDHFLLEADEVWGFGLEQDCTVLRQSFPTATWPLTLKQKMRNLPLANKQLSLKALCEQVLQKSLDKEQQMSLWSRRPLFPEQIKYAALDAHVLVLLHEQLVVMNPPPPVTVSTAKTSPTSNKFFFDETLKAVARLLRAVNVDCLHEVGIEGKQRVEVLSQRLTRARSENRVFVTENTSLSKHAHVYVLRTVEPAARFRELVWEFNLKVDMTEENVKISRCTLCNGAEFQLVSRQVARRQNPSVVTEMVFNDVRIKEMYSCVSCLNVVWQGPKYKERMEWLWSLLKETTPT